MHTGCVLFWGEVAVRNRLAVVIRPRRPTRENGVLESCGHFRLTFLFLGKKKEKEKGWRQAHATNRLQGHPSR